MVVQNLLVGVACMHCIDISGICVFMQCVQAPPLTEVLCYSTSNTAIKVHNRIILDFYLGLAHFESEKPPNMSLLSKWRQFSSEDITASMCHGHVFTFTLSVFHQLVVGKAKLCWPIYSHTIYCT